MWAPQYELEKTAYLMACKPIKMTKLPKDFGSEVAVVCGA